MGRWFEPNSGSQIENRSTCWWPFFCILSNVKIKNWQDLLGFTKGFVSSNLSMQKLERFSRFANKTFPLWILVFAGLAYLKPEFFVGLSSWVSPMLGIVMFGMGLTLSISDFKAVLSHPTEVILGIFAQYSLMPAIAYGLCVFLNLPGELAIGVILVGACPGGTSSNVLTYLARGDVALSVTLTSCTTLLAPFVTPTVVAWLAQEWVAIDPFAMFKSICWIILIPVAAGVAVHALIGEKIRKASDVLPLLSIAVIVVIVSVVVAGARDSLAQAAPLAFLAVILHNGLGLTLGYLLALACGANLAKRKCIALEVGTQNAGLGAALATLHFAAMPMIAVPSAIFSFWNIISGSIVASYFRKIDREKTHKNADF